MQTFSQRWRMLWGMVLLSTAVLASPAVLARDLDEIRADGVLRHLGIPYAKFVTGMGDGLDVELVRGFAEHLGVRYEFVQTSWKTAFGDLTGQAAALGEGGHAVRGEITPVRGDILANGVTVLPWRQEVVDYSEPTFPSGIWLMARADSSLRPITPTATVDGDIQQVRTLLDGREVLALENTCLDPRLYDLAATGAKVLLPAEDLKLNEMAPAILNNEAETTILDVPDALIALEKWPGDIKVIGPVSDTQMMGATFRKSSPQLREAFNAYLAGIKADGTYRRLVARYYPTVFTYFDAFFASR